MGHSKFDPASKGRQAWDAGRKLGAKRPLTPRQLWAIRFRLDHQGRLRDRAMFDFVTDSKLRGCDVVRMTIGDVVLGRRVRTRATVIQQRIGKPVRSELLDSVRASMLAWLERRGGMLTDDVVPSRTDHACHIATRQDVRLVDERAPSRPATCALCRGARASSS